MGPFHRNCNASNNPSIKLARNCIVIVLRKADPSDKKLLKSELETVRSHSWPDNGNRSISPAALSAHCSDSVPYTCLPLPSTEPKCTCSNDNQPDGRFLFNQFVNENATCFWNPQLVDCAAQLTFRGFLVPSTLLISGCDFTLEVIRSAWSKRILKSPQNYEIDFIGDISTIECKSIQKAQFTPLAEALCKCIDEINKRNINATFEVIVSRLKSRFPDMELPALSVLNNSLKALIHQGKIFYNAERSCFICSVPFCDDNSSDSPTPAISSPQQELFINDRPSNYSESSSANRRSVSTQINSCSHNTNRISSPFTLNSQAVTWENENHLTNNKRNAELNSPLKRSSSFRIERHKFNSANENSENKGLGRFNRSRSLRLPRAKLEVTSNPVMHSQENLQDKNEPYKKQSVLSKWLRFGTSSSSVKTKNLKCLNFSSQFPEDGNLKSSETKATQTIKCGIENSNIATLIIKQASKHALFRCRQTNGQNSDHWPRNNKLCCCFDQCNCAWTCKGARHSKPSKHKRWPQADCYCSVCCCGNYNASDCCKRPVAYHRDLQKSYKSSQRYNSEYKDTKQLEFYNDVASRRITPMSTKSLTDSNESRAPISSGNDKKLALYKHDADRNSHQSINQKALNSIVAEKDRGLSQIGSEQPTIASTNRYLKDYHFDSNIMQVHHLPESGFSLKENDSATNKLVVDNSVNVKIEIGSTASINATKTMPTNGLPVTSSQQQLGANKLSQTSAITSFPILNGEPTAITTSGLEFPQTNKATVVSSAATTTFRTSMTLPNGQVINRRPGNTHEDIVDVNQNNKCGLAMNNQNNNFHIIDPVTQLSPIRQKVAKAKAEFFNSTGPQTILTNNSLLESRVN